MVQLKLYECNSTLEINGYFGRAGEGKISSAARADYAKAAAEALTCPGQENTAYELAGDSAYTLTEFVAELSNQLGKEVPYNDLPEREYERILKDSGFPDPLAQLLSSSDAAAAQGAVFDDSHQLSQLLGRGTESISSTIKKPLERMKTGKWYPEEGCLVV